MKTKLVKDMTREEVDELAARHGIATLPKDHWIYSEGPSVRFVNRMPKPEKNEGEGQK